MCLHDSLDQFVCTAGTEYYVFIFKYNCFSVQNFSEE